MIPDLHRYTVLICICLCITSIAYCEEAPDWQHQLLLAARLQIGVTVHYDPAYRSLSYPNGDLPVDRGVCTDVLIRALRESLGIDLQSLVHQDMLRSFQRYPQKWGLSAPDKNIDHRRVPNLQTFFTHHATSFLLSQKPGDYQPADIVTSLLPQNLPHIMIVSDHQSTSSHPLVIHNIGRGTREEDYLFRYPVTGHYRIDPDRLRAFHP